MANAKRTNDHDLDIGGDLRIAKMTRRASGAGTWVIGTIAGYRFNALVFPEHAECPEYELGDSRISKLWLERIADRATVLNFDRGWDVRPTDATAVAVMDFLAAGLADHIYHA
ncbi:MAG: hypothetical protein NTW96_16695 [Planctomycetia bacterium]|nr:hypothetical protein [Planctomycetia bacterium]